MRPLAFLVMLFTISSAAFGQNRPRGRDLVIPFPGVAGPNNPITDVAGVAVGHETIIQGEGKLTPGVGPIRTGVNRMK